MSRELDKELRIELLKLRDDSEDFIRGMFEFLEQDEDKQEMLDAIKDGDVKTSADAILLGMAIYEDNGGSLNDP